MGIIDTAKDVAKVSIDTGTSTLKLTTHMEKMVRHQDMIIKIYEGMSELYAGNMNAMLGEEGMSDALAMYSYINTCREQLKGKGL